MFSEEFFIAHASAFQNAMKGLSAEYLFKRGIDYSLKIKEL
jgi:hypothetical protein